MDGPEEARTGQQVPAGFSPLPWGWGIEDSTVDMSVLCLTATQWCYSFSFHESLRIPGTRASFPTTCFCQPQNQEIWGVMLFYFMFSSRVLRCNLFYSQWSARWRNETSLRHKCLKIGLLLNVCSRTKGKFQHLCEFRFLTGKGRDWAGWSLRTLLALPFPVSVVKQNTYLSHSYFNLLCATSSEAFTMCEPGHD